VNEILTRRLKSSMRTTIIALVLLMPALLQAAPPANVTPYKAEYKALIKLIPVQVDVSLHDAGDGTYVFKSDIHTRSWASLFGGNVAETSRFRVVENGVEPLEYEKRDRISDDEKDISTRFEGEGSAVSIYRGKEKRLEHDGPLVDLLTLRYVIVDGKGRLKEIEVSDLGLETVETGIGPMRARKLQYAAVDDPVYTVWAAPELDYQLVRIEQHKNGKLRASLTLDSYRPIIKKK
jgi:hypothetical protein